MKIRIAARRCGSYISMALMAMDVKMAVWIGSRDEAKANGEGT